MSLNRKQRRIHLNEAANDLRKKGLSPEILNVRIVLFTRRLMKILGHRKNPTRSSDAAHETQKILDLSLRNNLPEAPLDCQKGCSHCCHNFVSASAPQIFRIARHIREMPDRDLRLGKIRAADDTTRGIERSQRYLSRQPCALLEGGGCSVYEHRPTACRGMASHDVTTCEKRVDGVLTPPAYELLRGLIDFALAAALKVSDLPQQAYELNQGLRIVLEEADAEQRWLDGEDIFHDVMKDDWADAPGMSSSDFLDAIAEAAKGNAMDIEDFQLP